MTSNAKNKFALWGLAAALSATPGGAQQQIIVTDFSVVLAWHEPPFDKQMKSLLEGARAQPQPGNRYVVNQAKLRTFLEHGEPQMVVETPQCFYDSDQRTVSSPSTLQVQTADGRFSIEGEGFQWQQTNSWLIISNRIHTTVHADLLDAQSRRFPTNAPAKADIGIEILSDQFEYAVNSGVGAYVGNVRVTGTNLAMTAQRLTIKVPASQSEPGLPGGTIAARPGAVKLESITAEGDVVADYAKAEHEPIHATGERATYQAETGLLRVSGHPAWRSEQREGRGDELIIEPTNKVLHAVGHAWLKLPLQGQSETGLLPQIEMGAPDSPPATNQIVEIGSDTYELRTNLAVFRKDVRLTQGPAGQPRSRLSCGLLTTSFAGTNQVERIVAEHAVLFEQLDPRSSNRLSAGKMVYTAAPQLVELTDQPTWQAGTRDGKGDLIRLDRDHMLVRGNASMRFPAEELAPTGQGQPGAGARAVSGNLTNQVAQIFSGEYSLGKQADRLAARFQGGVYVTHPQLNLASETLDIHLPQAGRQVESVVASRSVAFNLLSDRGQSLRGTGDQAVYTYAVTPTATNKFVELTGHPALQTTNGLFRSPVIILDLAQGKIIAPARGGKYLIQSSVAAIDTNMIRWPNPKTLK